MLLQEFKMELSKTKKTAEDLMIYVDERSVDGIPEDKKAYLEELLSEAYTKLLKANICISNIINAK